MNFVTPLNVHSEYEIAQSIIKLKDYITFAKNNNFDFIPCYRLANNANINKAIENIKI